MPSWHGACAFANRWECKCSVRSIHVKESHRMYVMTTLTCRLHMHVDECCLPDPPILLDCSCSSVSDVLWSNASAKASAPTSPI